MHDAKRINKTKILIHVAGLTWPTIFLSLYYLSTRAVLPSMHESVLAMMLYGPSLIYIFMDAFVLSRRDPVIARICRTLVVIMVTCIVYVANFVGFAFFYLAKSGQLASL